MTAKLLSAAVVAIGLASGSAQANVLAYGATGDGLFGVLDLNTGVFTELGNMGQRLTGLGIAGGVLYGSGYPYNSPTLFTVNTSNGALTVVNNNFSPGYYDMGSTIAGLFAIGNNDQSLYSINPIAGTATLIGPTLLGNFMSTGASTLYVTGLNTLYSTDTTTGAATLVGFPNAGYIDLVAEGGMIYAVSEDFRIYTLEPSTGVVTFRTNVTGTDSFFWGLAPDPLTAATPLPATLPLFATGFAGLGLLGWRRKRKAQAVA